MELQRDPGIEPLYPPHYTYTEAKQANLGGYPGTPVPGFTPEPRGLALRHHAASVRVLHKRYVMNCRGHQGK